MAENVDPQGGEIEVSPEERRFLERFFRRQALPYAVGVLVLSLAASAWLATGDDVEREARTAAAIAQLRSETLKLREQLVGVEQALADGGVPVAGAKPADQLADQLAEAKRSIRTLESRVAAPLVRRIEALEARLEGGAARAASPPAGAAPADASAWDVSAILERLYALEMRQQEASADWQAGARSRDARVTGLEDRLGRLERRATPASPAP